MNRLNAGRSRIAKLVIGIFLIAGASWGGFSLVADPAPPSDKVPMTYPASSASRGVAPLAAASAGDPLPVRPVIAGMSRTAKLEGLVATRKANDLLQAHKIVSDCVREDFVARRYGAGRVSEECEGLIPKYRMQYMRWLHEALDAEVPGSATAFLVAGPNGELSSLESQSDDLLVAQWKKKAIEYLERDSKNGDLSAVISLYEQYRNGAIVDLNTTKAFGALVYANEIFTERGDSKALAATKKELDRLSKSIDKDQMKLAYEYKASLKPRKGEKS